MLETAIYPSKELWTPPVRRARVVDDQGEGPLLALSLASYRWGPRNPRPKPRFPLKGSFKGDIDIDIDVDIDSYLKASGL